MKIFKKIFAISIIISFIFNISLAEDNNDCQIFGRLRYKQEGGKPNGFEIVNNYREKETEYTSGFLSVEEQRKIIDNNSLNTALLNLKKYCCDNELGGLKQGFDTCKADEPYFNPNVPDSPYLFDHIFDVIMRRLSGFTGDTDIYTKTNMTGDPKGLKRRQRINEQAENISGANPQVIINEYPSYWQESPMNLGYNINNDIHKAFLELNSNTFLEYVAGKGGSADSKKVANALQNYENRSLYDRYNNACSLSEFFYGFFSQAGSSDDKNRILRYKDECNRITTNQIASEIKYISVVTKRSSNLFLSNYTKGYISYLEERARKLESQWKNSTDRFFDVVRAVPMLIKRCTKG